MRRADGRALVLAWAGAIWAPTAVWACANGGLSGTGAGPAGQDAVAAGTAPQGPISIAEGALAAIAAGAGVPRERALELGAEDALLARGLNDEAPRVGRWLERVVLARQTLAELKAQAIAAGPPSDAEVNAITEARFWELARPRLVRVTHAVVLSDHEDPAARAQADAIARATLGAKTSAQFKAAARGVKAGNFTVRVESLPPLARDGRAVDPAFPPPAGPGVQQFDATFAAAAQQLQTPTEQSPVVHTSFGYHVIFLDSIVEPKQPSLEERRALLHDEIMTQRAQALSSALLERTRVQFSPEQSRSAQAAMQSVSAHVAQAATAGGGQP